MNVKNLLSMQRLLKACAFCLFIFLILMFYAGFIAITGLAIPCIFHNLTGFECPGCGVTRMCMSLFSVDVISAAKYNFAVMTLLPVFVYFTVRMFYIYVKIGYIKFTKIELIILWLIVVYLVGFGFLRNFI